MKETKFKDTEIGMIPEDRETLYIYQITDISTGATPSTNIKEYWENGTIRWMSSGELNNKSYMMSKVVSGGYRPAALQEVFAQFGGGRFH